ncbi:MAG: acetyl-CoA carboxylase biotin carboxylase subunit [Thermoplasmata archaeon]
MPREDGLLNKILVANRGEIAIRVMRACKELGIATVAVYSEADRTALFVRYADEAHLLGPPPARESYLKMDKIIDIALKTGAEGIHPGYGFLAENPEFSALCKKNGIEFIGPTAEAILALGDKAISKNTMRSKGVPVVPGTPDGIDDIKTAMDIAESVGFPVILKASAGGGGIGMRIVHKKEDLPGAIEATQRIALSSFGNPKVLLEKYLEEPRHIEFQIIADKKGNTIHVNERECSVQRRHQKLIEETPSCAVTPEIREKMGKAAVTAARAVNYTNAGTVEFMFSKGNFYFLEVNTRLQVEHPITELITGIDLVKEQIRVASGLELQYKQEDVVGRGAAMECRINAEDPLNNFLPAPGKIFKYAEPGGIGIRVDSGVYSGFTIPPFYDSLIAKLCAWGRNREECIRRMRRALWEFQITGVKTNIPFHEVVLNNPNFLAGCYNTSFIEKENILTQVQEYVRTRKGAAQEQKVAAISAAMSAVMAGITAQQGQSPGEKGG